MLFNNSYQTIAKNAREELKDRGSVFYAYCFKISTKVEFDKWLKKVEAKYPDATHHCWAYVLQADKSESHSSDDGEPANSAGKPILRAIQSKDLTQIGIVVVRYYGGVNLGIPGLINAYGGAAEMAISKAECIEVPITEVFEVFANYGDETQWYAIINNPMITVISQEVKNTGYKAVISSEKENSHVIKTFLESQFLVQSTFLYFQ